MEIDRLLKLEDTDEGKIEMIISNNLDLMYKGKAAVTIDNWGKLTNEILAWHKYEVEKLNMHVVGVMLPTDITELKNVAIDDIDTNYDINVGGRYDKVWVSKKELYKNKQR